MINPFCLKTIEFNISSDERAQLSSLYQEIEIHDARYFTQSGKYDGNITNVNFDIETIPFLIGLREKLIYPSHIYFCCQEPGTKLAPHIDDTRRCLINIPVVNKDEIPTKWYIDYDYSKPHEVQKPAYLTMYQNEAYLINTQTWHAVDNVSEHKRVFLQIVLNEYYPKVAREYLEGRLLRKGPG